MNPSQELLSNVVIHDKYARYIPEKNRRETWGEIVDRYIRMMLEKYGQPNDLLTFDWVRNSEAPLDLQAQIEHLSPFAQEIIRNAKFLYAKEVLPSMRAAQFAGEAIKRNPARIYNCAYAPAEDPRIFGEIMFLLLGGTGMGYSVQKQHVAKLPALNKSTNMKRYIVHDSIEGWADAIKAIMYWAFGLRDYLPIFDLSEIRDKGTRLVTSGGKAPGPDPLRKCLNDIYELLAALPNGTQLTPLQVHDIMCYMADAVLAGGIRRAAMIALFSEDDEEMMSCKDGEWWVENGQRGRANNSVVLLRGEVTKERFQKVYDKMAASFSGEPGIYWTNNLDWGTNPCCEIALPPYTFCNLTEDNAGSIEESVLAKKSSNSYLLEGDRLKLYKQEEFNNRSRVSAFFGTLQAGFTDFHYLRPEWQKATEKSALIGTGITGIASGDILDLDLEEAAQIAVDENIRVATIIGINPADRVTTIKPSGTTSCVVGSSSGIHAWHDEYYIRNIQTKVGSELYNYFMEHHPRLIKVMDRDKTSAVIGIPQHAPAGAIKRKDENALLMLERIFKYYDQWVKPGHMRGDNTNNVSATLYFKQGSVDPTSENPQGYGEDLLQHMEYAYLGESNRWVYNEKAGMSFISEQDLVGELLWENRFRYNGMAVLPYDGGNYANAPFETCTKEMYEELFPLCAGIDLTKIIEQDDNTNLVGEAACAGGQCSI